MRLHRNGGHGSRRSFRLIFSFFQFFMAFPLSLLMHIKHIDKSGFLGSLVGSPRKGFGPGGSGTGKGFQEAFPESSGIWLVIFRHGRGIVDSASKVALFSFLSKRGNRKGRERDDLL